MKMPVRIDRGHRTSGCKNRCLRCPWFGRTLAKVRGDLFHSVTTSGEPPVFVEAGGRGLLYSQSIYERANVALEAGNIKKIMAHRVQLMHDKAEPLVSGTIA